MHRARLPRPLRFQLPRCATAVAVACATVAAVAACRPKPAPPRPVPADAPRLVLFIVADQLAADYLVRFRPLLQHGLARLIDESVHFTEAHHDHAATVTANGHATLSTGTFAKHHGIIGNSWFSREEGEEVASVWDAEHGSSPKFLLRPSLGDLMQQAWPEAKVFGVGGKARSAILTAGQHPDGAFWYDEWQGEFVTSTYFEPEEDDEAASSKVEDRSSDWSDEGDTVAPKDGWRRAFHERKLLDPLFGQTWEPLLPYEEVRQYGILPLDYGWFPRSFPYAFGGPAAEPGESFYSSISDTPFLDGFVTDFTKALIDGEGVGADAIPDFLGVTYAMLDSVGHTHGPDAHETLDTLMRLDRTIGDLLDFVDQRIGLENVVVVLSSDHGVGRVPELLQALGQDAKRFGVEEITCIQRAGLETAREFGLVGSEWMPSLLYFDHDVLSERQVDAGRLARALGDRLAACPRVQRVLYPSEIQETSPDDIVAKFARSYHPDRSGDLLLQLAENTLTTSSLMASHGMPYRYDTHVPILLRLPGVPPKQISEPVRTADVAPTLAELLSLRDLPDARFDGASRLAMAREPAPVGAAATASP